MGIIKNVVYTGESLDILLNRDDIKLTTTIQAGQLITTFRISLFVTHNVTLHRTSTSISGTTSTKNDALDGLPWKSREILVSQSPTNHIQT